MMLRGRAVGGPRDKVIIEAGSSWSGFICKVLNGRYVWDHTTGTWVWTFTKIIRTGRAAILKK